MKKLSLIIAAAAALFLVSCTQEKLENPAAGQEVDVTLTAQLPGELETKAYADGTTVDILRYAVYNKDQTKPVYESSEPISGKVASVHLKLVSGKTYDFVFWADVDGNTVYDLKFDGQTMTVNYDEMSANKEENDAFYAVVRGWTINGPQSKKVYLTRPFAQINLGTDDLSSAQDNTFNPENLKSSMTARVANVLNFATEEVSGEAPFEYKAHDIPSTSDEFPFPNVGNGKTYEYLAMNYVLVGKTKTTVDCEFSVYEGDNTNATNTIVVPNVPVQRNYRTNIYGSLITDQTHVEVEVRPGIGTGENDVPVTELPAATPDREFYERLQQGGGVTVTAAEGEEGRTSINFNNLTIAEDLTLTLDAPVDEIILGGNNETASASMDTKSGSVKPNITIVVAKDVNFPKFKFNGTTENYTIKGDLETSMPLTEIIETSGNVKNFTVENVKATGNARIDGNNHTVGLIVKNCVATDLNAVFVDIFELRNAKILNNTIALAASANPSGDYRHAIAVYNCGDDILIEGNTITKTFKHGIFVQGAGASALTVKDNKISGVVEDGIKIDRSHKVVATGNVIDAADYGIRVDRLMPSLGSADITITDNTISIDGVDVDGKPATAIRVRHRNESEYAGEITVNLTAKGNKAGKNGIPSGCYVNFTSENMTVTGDYENAFDGCVIAGGNYYNTLADAISAGYTDIVLPAGEFTLSQSDLSKDLRITAASAEATKLVLAGGDLRWKTVELNNVTIISPAKGDMPAGGLISVEGTTVHNGCVIENVYFCLSQSNEFNDCTFNISNSAVYNVWTYGADVDFNNCVFNSAGKSALVYAHGNNGWKTVNFTDCKFYASTPVEKKAAIEIDSSICPFNVNIENCTAEGFALGVPSGNSLYNLKNGTLGTNCTITVDGIRYLADGFTLDVANNTYSVSNATGLRYFSDDVNVRKNTFSGKTVKLTADIDLENKAWTSVGQTGATQFLGVFDGQGYTISNLTINNTDESANCSTGLFGWANACTIKNVKVDGATVTGHHNVAVICGMTENRAKIESCHVDNATVSCTLANSDANGDKCGAVVGNAMYSEYVKGCTASNSTISASRDAGQVVGSAYEYQIIDCSATNVSVSFNGNGDNTNIREEVLGRIL